MPNTVNWAIPLACFSILVSLIALRRTSRKSRSEVERELVSLSNRINESFAIHAVKSPFAHNLKVPSENLKAFSGKAYILFLHINLLKFVHQHREFLGKRDIDYWHEWGTDILRPWIEADDDLRSIWSLECKSRGPKDSEFIKWIQTMVPPVSSAACPRPSPDPNTLTVTRPCSRPAPPAADGQR